MYLQLKGKKKNIPKMRKQECEACGIRCIYVAQVDNALMCPTCHEQFVEQAAIAVPLPKVLAGAGSKPFSFLDVNDYKILRTVGKHTRHIMKQAYDIYY